MTVDEQILELQHLIDANKLQEAYKLRGEILTSIKTARWKTISKLIEDLIAARKDSMEFDDYCTQQDNLARRLLR